jgi:hypothetical protein
MSAQTVLLYWSLMVLCDTLYFYAFGFYVSR